MTGPAINAGHHFQVPFGTFVYTHKSSDNTMASRTARTLAPRPTRNTQEAHHLLNPNSVLGLETGQLLDHDNWTECHTVQQLDHTGRRHCPIPGIHLKDDLCDDDDEVYLTTDASASNEKTLAAYSIPVQVALSQSLNAHLFKRITVGTALVPSPTAGVSHTHHSTTLTSNNSYHAVDKYDGTSEPDDDAKRSGDHDNEQTKAPRLPR
jgi:hypothetical protein